MKNQLVYNDQPISVTDEMLCLTDMWRAAGCPDDKRPNDWAATPAASQFIDYVAENLNAGKSGIWNSKRGRHNGGTWAHWQIGFAYAKYLSHEFHAWCNEVVRGRMKDMARRTALREQSRDTRNNFTKTLAAHGVEGRGFAFVTNSTYRGLFDKDASQLREARNLKPKENVRATMSDVEIAQVMLSEVMAEERIVEIDAWGVEPCAHAANRCARAVRSAVETERKSRPQVAA